MLDKHGVIELVTFAVAELTVLALHCVFWDVWAERKS